MERPTGRGPYLPGPAGRLQALRDAGQQITPAALGLVDAGVSVGGSGGSGLLFSGLGPDGMDPDFSSAAWAAALESFDAESFEDARLLLPHSLRYAASQPFRKIPRLLVLVAALTPAVSGDAFAQLKDPDGQMGAALHRTVLEAVGGQLGPGAVLLLQQVCVVSPCAGLCYMCVTADNVMQVFPAVPPNKRPLPLPPCRAAAAPLPSGGARPTFTHTAAAQPQPRAQIHPDAAGGAGSARGQGQRQTQPPTLQPPNSNPHPRQGRRLGHGACGRSLAAGRAGEMFPEASLVDSGCQDFAFQVESSQHAGAAESAAPAGSSGAIRPPAATAGLVATRSDFGAGGAPTVGRTGEPLGQPPPRNPHAAKQQHQPAQLQQPQQRRPAAAAGRLGVARPTTSSGSNASSLVTGSGGAFRRKMVGLLDFDLDLDLDLELGFDTAVSNRGSGPVSNGLPRQQSPWPRSPLTSLNMRQDEQLSLPPPPQQQPRPDTERRGQNQRDTILQQKQQKQGQEQPPLPPSFPGPQAPRSGVPPISLLGGSTSGGVVGGSIFARHVAMPPPQDPLSQQHHHQRQLRHGTDSAVKAGGAPATDTGDAAAAYHRSSGHPASVRGAPPCSPNVFAHSTTSSESSEYRRQRADGQPEGVEKEGEGDDGEKDEGGIQIFSVLGKRRAEPPQLQGARQPPALAPDTVPALPHLQQQQQPQQTSRHDHDHQQKQQHLQRQGGAQRPAQRPPRPPVSDLTPPVNRQPSASRPPADAGPAAKGYLRGPPAAAAPKAGLEDDPDASKEAASRVRAPGGWQPPQSGDGGGGPGLQPPPARPITSPLDLFYFSQSQSGQQHQHHLEKEQQRPAPHPHQRQQHLQQQQPPAGQGRPAPPAANRQPVQPHHVPYPQASHQPHLTAEQLRSSHSAPSFAFTRPTATQLAAGKGAGSGSRLDGTGPGAAAVVPAWNRAGRLGRTVFGSEDEEELNMED